MYTRFENKGLYGLGFPLWSQPPSSSNNSPTDWKIAQVSLRSGLVNKPFQVVFEQVIKGNRPNSQFGVYIDDVFIRDHSCLPAGDCDFENGFCKFIFSLEIYHEVRF
jgi:hypothetical protein